MNDLERFLNEQVGFLGCRTIFKKIHLVTEKITNPKSGLSLVSLAALYGDEKNNTLSFEQIVEEDTGAESVHSVIRALDVLARAYMAHVLNEHRDITIYLRGSANAVILPNIRFFMRLTTWRKTWMPV